MFRSFLHDTPSGASAHDTPAEPVATSDGSNPTSDNKLKEGIFNFINIVEPSDASSVTRRKAVRSYAALFRHHKTGSRWHGNIPFQRKKNPEKRNHINITASSLDLSANEATPDPLAEGAADLNDGSPHTIPATRRFLAMQTVATKTSLF
jgi:hypothetical protein